MPSVLQLRSLFRNVDEEQNWAEGASMWNVRIEEGEKHLKQKWDMRTGRGTFSGQAP